MEFMTVTNDMQPVVTNSTHELEPRIRLEVLLHLLKNARFGIDIDRMRKVSMIYDIVLSEPVILTSPTYKNLVNNLQEKAPKHLESVTSAEFMQGLTDSELQQQKHFCCILEKFIDGSFRTPADYTQYSYHYDIMRTIDYEETIHLYANILDYAISCDFEPILVRDYLENRVSVYQLYALVTYCDFEVLPNNVEYEYVVERVLLWFKREERA
jgi:hypothetical protein